MNRVELEARYFTSYTGIRLPLRLVNELNRDGVNKRITYFIGYYDFQGRIRIIEKIVYGEIEFSHHYEYNDDDVLEKAILIDDEELPRTLLLDKQGSAFEPI